MRTTAQSLNSELGTDLLSQLSVDDQGEVDSLNDQITFLTNDNKQALKERVKVTGLSKFHQNLRIWITIFRFFFLNL